MKRLLALAALALTLTSCSTDSIGSIGGRYSAETVDLPDGSRIVCVGNNVSVDCNWGDK